MIATREETRREFRLYMARSRMSLSQLAAEMGCPYTTLKQWISAAQFGTSKGDTFAGPVAEWMRANPLPGPELPGPLYQTRATRGMDGLLDEITDGSWGILYGPSGSQKSFLLEFRGVEAAAAPEPRLIYLRTSPSGMTPTVLLRRIAAALGVGYAATADALRQSIVLAMRRRRRSLGLVLDEADHLYHWVPTLETLRELGDLCRARPGRAGIGILVAGNERVWKIFEDRRSVYFEKWRARIEDEGLRVIGPSAQEAEQMLAGELGA
jgi:DNA transposition AAA+ family ATPase